MFKLWMVNHLYVVGGVASYGKIIVIVSGLALIIISDLVMEWGTFSLIRLLEGYGWPNFLYELRASQLEQQLLTKRERLKLVEEQLQKLSTDILPPNVRRFCNQLERERSRLEIEIMAYPANWKHLTPTYIGSLLRATEDYPYDRYGLDAITLWPRLWLILPKDVQSEIVITRQQLDGAVRIMAWGGLFALWMPFFALLHFLNILTIINGQVFYTILFTPLISAGLTVFFAYKRAVYSTQVYGSLIRASFDLYRFNLYQQLHWPLPENSNLEKLGGSRVTLFLHRGPSTLSESSVSFEHKTENSKSKST